MSEPATPALMIQGTGSNVGKSLTVAGLCRLFARRGLKVRPFKPQNMSNNAAVAADGGEIGRAQALQARAAGAAASVHMNPVLLKPESERGAQVILRGKRWATLAARDWGRRKTELLPAALESYRHLAAGADLMLIEGAGSPAETNLRAGDIANMGFAEAADIPVALVADIDRGGVIASLVGTHAVLTADEKTRIKGFIINRFRGDPALFDEGLAEITERTGWMSFGIVPYFAGAAHLPAEDSVDLEIRAENSASGAFRIVVPRLPRIANFDDLDPLRLEPAVSVDIVAAGTPLPDADLILIPGSKATLADLAALRAEGWDIDILRHHRLGRPVVGLCGGYQMLGRIIRDPDGEDGAPGEATGLGLLDVETTLGGNKRTAPAIGVHVASGTAVSGYEIHLGNTIGADCARPLFEISGNPDGATSADGLVSGTYLHGMFAADGFRRAFLGELGAASDTAYEATIDRTLDALADHLEAHLDIDAIRGIAGLT